MGDVRIEALVEYNLGFFHHDLGLAAEAEQHYTRALALHTRAGNVRSTVNVRTALGGLLLETGRYDEAEHTLRRAVADARRIGSPSIEGMARGNLANVLDGLGRHDEEEQERRAAIPLFQAAGRPAAEALEVSNLANTLTGRGELDLALALSDRALAIETHSMWTEVRVRRSRAILLLEAARPVEALEMATWCVQGAVDLGDGDSEGRALQVAAAALIDLGRAEEALVALERAEHLFVDSRRSLLLVECACARALALAALERTADARVALDTAQTRYQEHEGQPYARTLLADLERARRAVRPG